MKIISFSKLLLILTTQTIHFSEQIKHINESSSIDACEGKDVDLVWKVDEEKNKISKLEWYFNNKTICFSSPVDKFTVEPHYLGRIERIGRTEIRLKNVSRDDEGRYVLFPLFLWSTSQNMPKIVRILEPPRNQCTCNIGHPPDFTSEQASYCGRPQVSLVWKRKQTFEVLGEGNHILNSTLQDKEVLCCQDGEAMQCVDDSDKFCTTVSIPRRDTERPSEVGNTQHTNSVTMPGTCTGSTNIHHMQPFVLATFTVCLLATILTVLLLIIICRIGKKNKDVEEILRMLKTKTSETVIVDERNALLAHSSLVTKDSITESQPTTDSEANIEIQIRQHSSLYSKLKKASALREHQQSCFLETMKELRELREAALCKICFVKEMSVVFMPCSHSVSCAYCSMPLKKCPICREQIKMKMNICSD